MMIICDHSAMDKVDIRRANLQRLINELAGGNVTAFGRMTKKKQSQLADMLDGRKGFGERVAESIEDQLNLEPGWLSTPQPERITFRQPTLAAEAEKAEDGYTRYSIDDVIDGPYCPTPNRRQNDRRDGDRRSDVIELHRLNVSGSMGAGDILPGAERSVGTVSVDAAWLRQNVSCTSVSNLALLDGRGDSMAGTYSDGDILVVDRGVHNADVDAIYVLQNGDELYIKRLQRLGGNRFMMISDNKAYIAREITLGEGSDYRVLARVVGLWNWKKL